MATGLFVLYAGASHGEVTWQTDQGFVSEHELTMGADPRQVWRALTAEIDQWWDADHSWSGEASAFSMDARAGGCFCEINQHVQVEHLRVVKALTGRELVLLGGLGPLQNMPINGVMTFRLNASESGTRLQYRYAVSGTVQGGLAGLAQPVDQVQLGQLQRLQAYIEGKGH